MTMTWSFMRPSQNVRQMRPQSLEDDASDDHERNGHGPEYRGPQRIERQVPQDALRYPSTTYAMGLMVMNQWNFSVMAFADQRMGVR